MAWSAASVARGLTTGKRVRLVSGYTAVALLGERRTAPPGTRLKEDAATSFLHTEDGGKTAKEASHEDTHNRH